MSAIAAEVSQILETLPDEDLRSALDYVRFLSDSRKKTAKMNLKKIQNIFAADKGWKDEQEMLEDMANFRRARTA